MNTVDMNQEEWAEYVARVQERHATLRALVIGRLSGWNNPTLYDDIRYDRTLFRVARTNARLEQAGLPMVARGAPL